VTQEEAGSAKDPDIGHQGHRAGEGDVSPGRRKRSKPERPSFFAFIGLLVAALATLAAIVSLAIIGVRYFSAFMLLAAALILLLALIFTEIRELKAFQIANSTILIIALVASGSLVVALQRHSHPSARNITESPQLRFTLPSPAIVPWCNYFYLQTEGVIPPGYKILIFDASADSRYNVTSIYSYDHDAENYNGDKDDWVTRYPLYVGSEYRQNENGKPLLENGQHVSNAGYTVVVSAVLVSAYEVQIIEAATAPNLSFTRLPHAIATAQLDTIRSGDVTQCVDAGN
jgi:hypothetical protein